MSKSHMPPVPAKEQSTKGPKAATQRTARSEDASQEKEHVPDNLEEQGQQGNIRQNTTARGRSHQ